PDSPRGCWGFSKPLNHETFNLIDPSSGHHCVDTLFNSFMKLRTLSYQSNLYHWRNALMIHTRWHIETILFARKSLDFHDAYDSTIVIEQLLGIWIDSLMFLY